MTNRPKGKSRTHLSGAEEMPPFCRAHGCEVCLPALQAKHAAESAIRPPDPPPTNPALGRQAGGSVGVAVIDDDAHSRALLKQIFMGSDEFHSSGFFATGQEALAAIPETDARVLLVRLELPGDCGIRCALKLRTRMPWLKIIVTATLNYASLVALAAGAGIDDYLKRPLDFSQTVTTLRFVSSPRAGKVGLLTPREERILGLMAEGLGYKEIEQILHLKHSLFRKLQQRIYRRLSARDAAEAVATWQRRKTR